MVLVTVERSYMLSEYCALFLLAQSEMMLWLVVAELTRRIRSTSSSNECELDEKWTFDGSQGLNELNGGSSH